MHQLTHPLRWRHLLRSGALIAALTTPLVSGCDDDDARPDPDVLADTEPDTTEAPDTEPGYDGEVLEDVSTCGARPGAGQVCCRDSVQGELACVDGQWACPAGYVYVNEFDCGGDTDVVDPPDLGSSCASCGFGEYCAFDDALCGQGASEGRCEPIEASCDPSPEPVCGCDGQLHLNPCQAHADGVDVWLDGECSPPPGTFQCGARFCQLASEYCERRGMSQGLSVARCVPLADACSETSTPDCSCLAAEPCGESCQGDASTGLWVQCP